MGMRTSALHAVTVAVLAWSGGAHAAEYGLGTYLLGARGPLSGVTPPPGVFFQNDVFFYSGEAGGNIQLPFGGSIISGADAMIVAEAPSALWVTPVEVLGGNLGFTLTVPVGYVEVNASLGRLSASDEVFTVGDPNMSGFVGWHAGNFYWQGGLSMTAPIGDYQKGQLANIALHRFSTDVFGTATWLDPALGIDMSGAAGITFNAENEVTDYKTGTEFHLEWAASKIFSPQFNAGLVGYYYNQLTGDSGSGARLGAFQGEVVAIGGTLGYNLQLGKLPVSTRLKYYHEVAVENRLEGSAGFLTVAMPLWVPPPAP